MNKFHKRPVAACRNAFFLIFLVAAGRLCAQDTWNTATYAASVAAQELKAQRVVPPAPEAAELGKYGNIPISMFTGTASVSIPIYEIAGARLHLPVALSYNSSGFKPQDVAGWVELNWSLNAGGVITRSVAGNPDEMFNYFNTNNYVTNLPATNNDLFGAYNYMKYLQQGTYESQPDTYFYNFAGISGKFLLNPDQSVVKKEKNNLLIYPQGFNSLPTFTPTFQVVDENGVTYQFNDAEQATTTLDDGPGGGFQGYLVTHGYVYDSSWYLTSMTSADGLEQITFSYLTTAQPHSQYQDYMTGQSVTYSSSTQNNVGNNWTQGNTTIANPPNVTTYRKYLQSLTYTKAGVTLCKIVFDAGTNQRLDLDHNLFPGEQLLNDIKVYSFSTTGGATSSTLIKQFNFSYSYFGNPSQTGPGYKRLRLDQVQEMNVSPQGGPNKPPYSFTYNNAAVPAYGQASIDSWGYCNSPNAVTTLVPTIISSGQNFGLGANRSPDLTSTLNTVLTQVTYPTGGSTAFNYELNDAKDGNGNTFSVGGLRVKQSIDYSFNGQPAVAKSYLYQLNDGSSSGSAIVPSYMTTSTYQHYAVGTWGGGFSPDYFIGYVTVTANSVCGLGAFPGSHIGYSQVTSYLTDVNTGKPLGKTITNYNTVIGNAFDSDIGNGDLLMKQDFDKDGNLLEEQDNIYGYGSTGGIASYTVHSAALQNNALTICGYTLNGVALQSWKLSTDAAPVCNTSAVYLSKTVYTGQSVTAQWKNLVDQKDKKYDPATGTYVLEEKQYTYGNPAYTFPTIIHEKAAGGNWLVTNKKYAADYAITGTPDVQSAAIRLLQSKNMIGTEIETSQFLTDSVNPNRYVAGVLNMYSNTSPYLVQLYQVQTATPLSAIQTSASLNGAFSFDPSYKPWGSISYDSYGNVIQQNRSNGAPTSYIWDYNNSLPVAEVKAAAPADIAYTSFEIQGTGTYFSGNWLVPANPLNSSYAVTGSYSYNLPAGQTISNFNTLSASKQYVVSYWSKNGPLTVGTNTGSAAAAGSQQHNGWVFYRHTLPAGSTSVSLTTAATNTIDELRLFPAGAQMGTTTYNPLVGVSGMATPANTVLSYQYDGLNRLSLVTNEDGNIVKQYSYNYGTAISAPAAALQTLFYNSPVQQTFTSASPCTLPAVDGTATYSIPFAKYVSAVSQAAADNMAAADMAANGQNYANANAPCLYWNVAAQARLFKNNCLPSQGSSTGFIIYQVAANKYSSSVSQAAANSLAANEISTTGQALANSSLTCSCGVEGQAVINGACQTGTRYNSSSTLMANGTWQCTYYYQFSDGSISQYYYSYSSSPCPLQ